MLQQKLPACADCVAEVSPLINPTDGAEMVFISAGEFLMGTSEEELAAWLKAHPNDKREDFTGEMPQREVYLDAYYMYRHPVTVAQYRTFCQAAGWSMPEAPKWGWRDDHPIVNVTWHDVTAYAEWAGAAVPTEAQWEKAARGTDGRIYPWGNTWDAGKVHCSKKSDGDAKGTTPVGSFPAGASPYGALDMAGNVREWCVDWYAANYYQNAPDRNPTGPDRPDPNPPGLVTIIVRVLRGGAWYDHDPRDLRVTSRGRIIIGPRLGDYGGFRCVCVSPGR